MRIKSPFLLPEAALASHTAVVGMTGSGKTSTEKLIVEHVVAQGHRVCVLDTLKSDWWGITSSADGKRPGLPFKILGGPRGHVPLHSSAGKAIGQLVGTGKLPLSIIDMADLEAGGVQRFFVDFAQALWKSARGVVYLVIEEAHEIAPKERAGFIAENMAIHWAKKLATGSRTKGIRLIVATQRTQALHNAVLGSCATLIAHRIMFDADQAPVLRWVQTVDKGMLPAIAESLSSLPDGSAWLCAGNPRLFERVALPKFGSYDNTRTPDGDDGAATVKTAPIDPEELRAILGEALREAEANDPAALKKRIRALEQHLAKTAAGGDLDAVVQKGHALGYQAGYAAGKDAGRTEAREELDGVLPPLLAAITAAGPLLATLDSEAAKVRKWTTARPPVARAKALPAPAAVPVARARADAAPAAVVNGGSGDLDGPQGRLLGALAWWAAMGHPQPSRAQAAAIAGWRVTSGHLKNVAGALRSKGLIDYPGPGSLTLTAEGRAVAPAPDDTGDLHARVAAILDGPQRQVFTALQGDADGLGRDALALRCGWAATSGHLKNVVGSLRSLEIVEYPAQGVVRLAEWLR